VKEGVAVDSEEYGAGKEDAVDLEEYSADEEDAGESREHRAKLPDPMTGVAEARVLT